MRQASETDPHWLLGVPWAGEGHDFSGQEKLMPGNLALQAGHRWIHVLLLEFHTHHEIHANTTVWGRSQRKESRPRCGWVWDLWLLITRAGAEPSHQGQPFSKMGHTGWGRGHIWGSGLEQVTGDGTNVSAVNIPFPCESGLLFCSLSPKLSNF